MWLCFNTKQWSGTSELTCQSYQRYLEVATRIDFFFFFGIIKLYGKDIFVFNWTSILFFKVLKILNTKLLASVLQCTPYKILHVRTICSYLQCHTAYCHLGLLTCVAAGPFICPPTHLKLKEINILSLDTAGRPLGCHRVHSWVTATSGGNISRGGTGAVPKELWGVCILFYDQWWASVQI